MAPKKREDSATRRTRSQVAPDWTLTDSLTLVNEIGAVEADCRDALSYYQKWKMIADNSSALGVNRTFDQCRRKWDSLFADYNCIKGWEADSGTDSSYWELERETRRAAGLPVEFDRELFNVVGEVFRGQVERAFLNPKNVLEDADADPLGVIAPPVLKKQNHQLTPQKRQIEVNSENETADNGGAGFAEAVAIQLKEKVGSLEAVKAGSANAVVTQLREKAETIKAVLEGRLAENKDYTLSDLRKGGASHINLARRQCDKLIDCFSVIVGTLEQF